MARTAGSATGGDSLDKAFARLQEMLPAPLGFALGWLHSPSARFVRIPLGILCIVAGLLWFLPVVGLEFLPMGLLLIAQDVPFMRAPVGKAILRLLDGVERMVRWWKARRAS